MKKLFVIGALLLACVFNGKAHEADTTSNAKDRLEKIEQLADKAKEAKAKKSKKLVDFEFVNNFGFGSHALEDNGFNQDFLQCREIWFNAFGLVFNPASWFSASLGLNCKWDRFLAADDAYIYADPSDGNTAKFATGGKTVQEAKYLTGGADFSKLTSQVNLFSLEVPVRIAFKAGYFGLKLGAQAEFPLVSRQKERAYFGDTRVKTRVDGVDVAGFYYGFYGELSWNDIGIYAKYSPGAILPGTVEDLITLGLVFGF